MEEKGLSKNTNLKDTLMYKLRLSRLDKTQRSLQKHGVVTTDGFLTIEGAQVYLDYLWQNDKLAPKAIAESLDKIRKEKKNED